MRSLAEHRADRAALDRQKHAWSYRLPVECPECHRAVHASPWRRWTIALAERAPDLDDRDDHGGYDVRILHSRCQLRSLLPWRRSDRR